MDRDFAHISVCLASLTERHYLTLFLSPAIHLAFNGGVDDDDDDDDDTEHTPNYCPVPPQLPSALAQN